MMASSGRLVGLSGAVLALCWFCSGSSADGLNWALHPDPVMGPPDAVIGGLSVLKDGSTFRTWHDHGGPGQERIMHNTSGDGVTWGASAEVYQPSGTNDATPKVRMRNGMFHMWVGSVSGSGVNYATSADGLSWQSVGNVPLLGSAYTVLADPSGFEAWYGGTGIGYRYATSSDGLNWQDEGLAMPLGEFPYEQASAYLDVVKADGFYHMWYSAHSGSGPNRLAYARSRDGRSWQKLGLVNGLDAVSDISTTSVIADGDLFKIWFLRDGGGNNAFYATAEIPEPATLPILAALTLVGRRRRH